MLERVATYDGTLDRDESRQELFSTLVGNIRTELFNFALRLTGNRQEAEDLLQESYFKAFKYFHQLREQDKFKEWIFQITANQFKNFLRKKKKENTFYHDDTDQSFIEKEKEFRNPDELFMQSDRTTVVRQALDHISPKMRSVLVLFEIEGYSIEEVSDTLGISRGTVKSRLHYARKKLREILEEGPMEGKIHFG
ncbi:MAG: RNA polymerase sigma factor [bacterium]|jgi:RNA polymerase sigma-70 factor (ECF subfamily)|nr:RNA polymerase sigma factor [bacterium]